MANLIDIRRRIRSVRNTQQITRAMKFVAAAKLRKAQERVFGARPYSARMLRLINELAAGVPDRSHPLLEDRGEGRILLLVVSGDKGLCGGFNTNIQKATYAFMESREGIPTDLALVGRKAFDHFGRRHYEIVGKWIDELSHVDFRLAERVAAPLTEAFLSGQADRVYIVYNQFKSVIQQQITVEQLLPVIALEPEAEPSGASPDFIFDQPRETIYQDLFPRHVVVQIYHALLESVASEQGARMTAMDAATKNAAEMIDRLVLFRNRVRQAAITKEIIEIVSGAAALE